MIEANATKLAQTLKARDQNIADSFSYIASVFDVEVPNYQGPVASAILADVVSHISAGNGEAAKQAFIEIDTVTQELQDNSTVGWQSSVLPQSIWKKMHRLFDTDAEISFNPRPPTSEQVDLFTSRAAEVRDILARFSPAALAEFDQIVKITLLGGPEDETPLSSFDGCSTFFCPGAILINVAEKRTLVRTLEVLLHEASHVLLYAIVGSDGLSANDPEALFASPLRPDPRPMEGIFHAAFVTARVHWVISYALSQAGFPEELRDEFETEKDRLEMASRTSLEVMLESCIPTPPGEKVFSDLKRYWSIAV